MEEAYWIGTLLLALSVGLEEWYRRYQFRKRLKEILREHLSDPRWTWRSFEGLQRAIKEDADRTKELLLEIGARPSEQDKDVWKLQ
jgi:hypothetical protein